MFVLFLVGIQFFFFVRVEYCGPSFRLGRESSDCLRMKILLIW
jgi:hypothetical protein